MVKRLSAQDDTNTPTTNANITSGSVTGITDLAIADGGTGASTAPNARTNLGLGNVDNTSDVNKPISTATQTALNAKGDASTNTASSTDNTIALFNSTTGKVIKQATGTGVVTATGGVYGTKTNPTGAFVGTTDTQTLTNKTLNDGVVTADPTVNLGIASKQYVDNKGTSAWKHNVLPTGSINGSNTSFTVPDIYVANTLRVHLNGQRLTPGGANDYTETSSGFTMVYAPSTNDVLTVDYMVNGTPNFAPTESIINGATPTGLINGSNTLYSLPTAYVPNSLRIFKNGVRMAKTSDYTENPTAGTFTMVSAPASMAVLLVDYQLAGGLATVGSNSFSTGEAVSGTVNGTNTVFTTANAYAGSSLEVYINGLLQYRTTDYTETNAAAGTFTFVDAPKTNDVIRVNYQRSLSTSSNADTVDGYHADDIMPIGSVIPYAGTTPPSGNWQFCYGQFLSRTTYVTLFSRLGTSYGNGDGSTTFRLPDMRGFTPVGKDDMGGTPAGALPNGTITGITSNLLGSRGGEDAHGLTIPEIPSHSHQVARFVGSGGDTQIGGGSNFNAATATSGFTGGGEVHNNMQPSIILNYIIKVL